MKRIRFRRPSPALVISCISLFVALSGVGYAAARIGSKQIKNNSVAGKDIKNSTITGKDVKNSGLTGSDVKNNSLTGSDIVESKLGKVASAASADSANTVGGVRVIPFSFRSNTTTAQRTVATIGGVQVITGCSSNDPDLNLKNVSGGSAEVNFANIFQTNDTTRSGINRALANNDTFGLSPGGVPEDGASGQAGFVSQSGRAVRLQYSLNRNVAGVSCSISGVIIG
jgi:hypothetical protein